VCVAEQLGGLEESGFFWEVVEMGKEGRKVEESVDVGRFEGKDDFVRIFFFE